MSPGEIDALRLAIIAAVTAKPLPLYQIERATQRSTKRVVRELVYLQEVKKIVRLGVGRLTQYGLPGAAAIHARKRFADIPDAILARKSHEAPAAPAGSSWWVGKDRDAFAEAAREKQTSMSAAYKARPA